MLQLRRVKPQHLSSKPWATIRLAQHRRAGIIGRDASEPSPEGKSQGSQTDTNIKHPTSSSIHGYESSRHSRTMRRRPSKWTAPTSSTHPAPSTNASEAGDKTERPLVRNFAVKPYINIR